MKMLQLSPHLRAAALMVVAALSLAGPATA
jgi:hypothetical protein